MTRELVKGCAFSRCEIMTLILVKQQSRYDVDPTVLLFRFNQHAFALFNQQPIFYHASPPMSVDGGVGIHGLND